MKLCRLNKTVLILKGSIAKLLNGLTSNTLDKPKNAFLDSTGKIIAVFDEILINKDEILIIIEKPFLENLRKHLEKYLPLTKTKMEVANYSAYLDLEGDYILGKEELRILQKNGQMIISKKDLPINVSDEEFTLFRLENKMPLHGIDCQNEMLLNLDDEDFVSYTKGCYLGQEIIARVHNLGKPPKKLIVKYEDDCNESEKKSMTSKCKDKTGRILGFVFVKNG